MVKKTDRKQERTRRHIRVRRKISGTSNCPRLCVYRSNANIYAQIVDDEKGVTLVSASTLDKEVKEKHANKVAAKEVGSLIAKRAMEKKIENEFGMPLEELLTYTKANVMQSINKEIKKGISLKGNVISIIPQSVTADSSGMFATINSKAKVELKIKGL